MQNEVDPEILGLSFKTRRALSAKHYQVQKEAVDPLLFLDLVQ